jgi:hypothetical protein
LAAGKGGMLHRALSRSLNERSGLPPDGGLRLASLAGRVFLFWDDHDRR